MAHSQDFCMPDRDYLEWSHAPAKSAGFDRRWERDKLDRLVEEFSAVAIAEEINEEVSAKFERLADQWQRETAFVSSVDDLISNQNYQSIIRLGWPVVTLLLKDLQQNKRFWFPALSLITGVRPFDRADAGDGKRMTKAWLTWGKRKGLI